MRRRTLSGTVILVISLVAMSIWSVANAAGVVIGPFCIEGVELTRNEDQRTYESNGYWTPIELQYSAPGGNTAPAQIAVFDAPLPKTLGLYSCTELKRIFAQRNINVVLMGSVSSLSIIANLFTATGQGSDNAVQIEPSKLSVEVGKVTSGQLTLAGGTIQLKDRRATVSNTNTLFGNTSTLVGVLAIKSSRLTLTQAKFLVGGGQFSTNMKTPDDEDQSFHLNLATKSAILWNGALDSMAPMKLTGPSINLASLSFAQAAISANQLRINAANGVTTSHFRNLAGQATSLAIAYNSLTTTLQAPTFSFQGVDAPIVQGADQWTAGPATISRAGFGSSDAKVQNLAGSELLHGALNGQFTTWSAQLVDGTTIWSAANATAISFFSPAGSIKQLTLTLKGPFANPQISGEIDLTSFALGRITINRDTAFNFSGLIPHAVLHVPIRFDAPSRSGTISFADSDQIIELTAGLSRASLGADLEIDLNEIKNSHLSVQPGKLQLGLFSAVATRPFLAGTTPSFGDLELGATNSTDLEIGAVSSGEVELTAKLVTMGQPIIRLGRKGSTSRAAITLNSKGNVLLGYDIGKGEATILFGDFEAQDSQFKLLDAGAEIDLSGVLVRDPLLQLSSLQISIVKAGEVGVGTGALRQLTATGSLLHKPGDPEHPNEITISGTLSHPLTIAAIDAAVVKIGKSLEMDLLSVQKLGIALTAVDANFSGGAKLSDASLALSADAFDTLKVNEVEVQKYTAARFSASGKIDPGNGISVNGSPGFSLQVAVDGLSDHLNGAGTAQLDGFTGSKQSEVKIKYHCKGSDHLTVPMEYNFAVSGVALAVSYTDGRIQGEGNIASPGLDLLVHTKSGNECNTVVTHKVISPKGKYWMDGTCSKGLKFYHCRWESPEVSYDYHFKLAIRIAGGLVILTNPRISMTNQGLNVCNLGAVVSKVKIIGGDFPQLDGSLMFPGAKEVVNGLLDLSFEAVETLVADSIGDEVNWLVDAGGTTIGNLFCLL
jgi:hypothetical protein